MTPRFSQLCKTLTGVALSGIILSGLTIATASAQHRVAASAAATSTSPYWEQKVSLFDTLPIYHDDIVFLGNSITDGGEFSELFKMQNIKNRGINADVINGVRRRLHQVTDGHPAKIFLLIGINDISHGHSVSELAHRYETLVEEIREKTPDTRLYLQSVMPIDNSFARYKNLKNKEGVIKQLNTEIRKIAARHDAVYIDLWPALDNGKGTLRKEFTNDGLHLTGAGYRAWAGLIDKFVRE